MQTTCIFNSRYLSTDNCFFVVFNDRYSKQASADPYSFVVSSFNNLTLHSLRSIIQTLHYVHSIPKLYLLRAIPWPSAVSSIPWPSAVSYILWPTEVCSFLKIMSCSGGVPGADGGRQAHLPLRYQASQYLVRDHVQPRRPRSLSGYARYVSSLSEYARYVSSRLVAILLYWNVIMHKQWNV